MLLVDALNSLKSEGPIMPAVPVTLPTATNPSVKHKKGKKADSPEYKALAEQGRSLLGHCASPKAFVADFIKTRPVEFDSFGRPVGFDEIPYIRSLLSEYDEQYAAHHKTIKAAGYIRLEAGHLQRAFEEIAAQISAESRRALSRRIAFQPSADPDAARGWLRLVIGEPEERDVVVLKHWLWLAKRKINRLPVCDHIMPVLVGESGAGKSDALKPLLQVLGPSNVNSSFNLAALNDPDQRHHFNLVENHVLQIEELKGAARADIQALKDCITSTSVKYRALGKNKNRTGSNEVVFIGTSNEHISDMIRDRQMRRFYEYTCLPRAEMEKNWDAINAFDYTALWQSVDENLVGGYVAPIRDELRDAQDDLATPDPLDELIEMLRPNTEEPAEFFSNDTIRAAVVRKLAAAGERYLAENLKANDFGKKLKRAGFKDEILRVNGVKTRGYRVNAVVIRELLSPSPQFLADLPPIVRSLGRK